MRKETANALQVETCRPAAHVATPVSMTSQQVFCLCRLKVNTFWDVLVSSHHRAVHLFPFNLMSKI